MKFRTLLFSAIALLGSMQADAQTWLADSVDMTAGYAKDIFYSLKNSTVKSQQGDDWDIAFQMTAFGDPQFNASVRANHIKRKVEVYSLHLAGSTHFTSLNAADTTGKTDKTQQLLNVDTSWGDGAFYQNRDKSQIFDYGWGKYAGAPTHFLNGDSLYLIKVNGVPYKIWIKQYISTGDTVGYSFKIASWDNTLSNDVVVKRKPTYEKSLFAYYNIATNTFTNREPDRTTWDLLFTQYAKGLLFTPNLQSYVGVLSNVNAQIAELKNIGPDTAKYQNYAFKTLINEIGDDWKTFNMTTFQYSTDTLTSYFVKSMSSAEYYQIRFTRFDGSGTGKTVFAKRKVADVVSVKDVTNNVSAYSLFSNPAVSEANLMIDVKENAAARLLITDMSGKLMQNIPVALNAGINAFRINTTDYASGMYFVTVTNGTWKIAEKTGSSALIAVVC